MTFSTLAVGTGSGQVPKNTAPAASARMTMRAMRPESLDMCDRKTGAAGAALRGTHQSP